MWVREVDIFYQDTATSGVFRFSISLLKRVLATRLEWYGGQSSIRKWASIYPEINLSREKREMRLKCELGEEDESENPKLLSIFQLISIFKISHWINQTVFFIGWRS